MSENLTKNFTNTSQFLNDIRKLTTEYTKLYCQDKKNVWSILLNYLQNESNNGKGTSPVGVIGHNGFLQSDIQNNSVWETVDSNADLDNDETDGTLAWFSTLYSEMVEFMNEYWNSTYYASYPSDTIRDDGLWNDSLEYFLKYFYQYIDPEGIAAYESSGYLVQNDDGTINTDFLKASIPVSGGVDLRVTDVKNADAGFFFVKESEVYEDVELTLEDAVYNEDNELLREAIITTIQVVARPWVIPWYNVNGHSYSYVRDDDKNIGVLANDEHLQFTRERWGGAYDNNIESISTKLDKDIAPNTTSGNPYIRLIMPEYKRRVEIEDLDRNFWVIAQVITAISAYLFDDDSPIRKMFKELLNEVMQLWENVLYLWAAIAGLGAEPYYTKVHTEVVYLPNSEEQSYSKYDNFVREDSNTEFFEYNSGNTYRIKNMSQSKLESILQERMRYLIQSYTDSNLCLIPVLRINNYMHNFYSCEVYPCVMLYNRNNKCASANEGVQNFDYDIYWFDSPIVIDLTNNSEGYWEKIYGIHEEEEEYYFKTMFDPDTNIYTEDEQLYFGAIRTTPIVNCVFNTTDGDFYAYSSSSVNRFNLKITMYDMAGLLSEKQEGSSTITIIPTSDNTSFSSNMTWQTTQNINFNDKDSVNSAEIQNIERGFYLGEMPSYYVVSVPINYSVEIKTLVGKRYDVTTNKWITSSDNIYVTDGATDKDELLFNTQGDFLDFLKEMDDFSLERIVENQKEQLKSSDGDVNIKLYTMKHNVGLWETDNPEEGNLESGSEKAYIVFGNLNDKETWYQSDSTISQYDLYKGNVEGYTKDDMYSKFKNRSSGTPAEGTYSRSSSEIHVGGLLYNPLTDSFVQYKDYDYMSATARIMNEDGTETQVLSNNVRGAKSTYSRKDTFVYINGDKMKDNNWYIRYIEVDGGKYVLEKYTSTYTGDDEDAKDLGVCYDDSNAGDLDNCNTESDEYYSGQEYTHIVTHIKIHIFTWDGKYYSKENWRMCWPTHNVGTDWLEDWSKSSGYDSIRSVLNNYKCISEGERDFEKYNYDGLSN